MKLKLLLYITTTAIKLRRLLLLFSADAFSLLQFPQLLFLLVQLLLRVLAQIKIQHDQISVGDVKPAQFLQRRFGVVDVLVDDVRGAFSVARLSESNLANRAVFPEDVVHVFVGDVEG